jgi:hypothetical protein
LGYSATAVGYTGVSSYISKVGIFTGGIRYFNGEITAIKTWDRILSDSEILAIYNQTALNENLTVLGNVGIGVTSPSTKLHVSNAAVINDAYGLALVENTSTGTGSAANSALNIKSKYGTSQFMQWENQGLRIGSRIVDNSAVGDVYFTAGADSVKMVIKANGNVGIGDTVPTSLSVNTSSLSVNSTRTDLSGALFQKSNGVLKFQQYWSTAGIVADVSAGDYFWKLANVNKMGLDTGTGALTVVGDVVAYGSPSDKRLKENIKPIQSALDKVSKLQGVTFDWIQKEDQILDIKEDIGFIAQDVQKVIPELVRENENGMLSMRHQGIAPILIEAIKELKAEIEELKLNKCNCNK